MSDPSLESWKIALERRLLDAQACPAVLTTANVQAMAQAGRPGGPSLATFHRWLQAMVQAGKLRAVIKGVYLNRMGRPDAQPAAAAQWVRKFSVPSLSWVLEQAWVTNNFGDTVTCVIPLSAGMSNPQLRDRHTQAGPFQFFAMPAHLVLPDRLGCKTEDALDDRFDYPRTTPEKALLDWIYLGASPRSRLQRPPLDLDLDPLDRRRLARLAKAMKIEDKLEHWLQLWRAFQADPETQANASLRFSLGR